MDVPDWSGEHDFTVDGVAYRSLEDRTNDDQMVLFKSRPLVDTYVRMVAELAPRTILELGIFAGGSTALLSQLARPEKLVAIDHNPVPCEPLERFIDRHDLRSVVAPYYDVDQADTARLGAIMAAEFDGPIDLVID